MNQRLIDNASNQSGMQGHDDLYAAIDLGTNNCRLLIAQPKHNFSKSRYGLKIFDSFSRIVRLGEGVAETGQLSANAMERTIAALQQCSRKLAKYPVKYSRFVATEACRRAKNSEAFLDMVQQETGLKIEIIDSSEEAELAFKGCASLLKETPSNALAFDIGGGSTEFMWVEVGKAQTATPLLPHKVKDCFSMPHGVMNLSENFGGSASAEVYFEEMVDYLASQLQKFDQHNQISQSVQNGQMQLISTSGTVTTLAAIYLGLQRYERAKIDGITLGMDKLSKAISSILDMRASERFHHPCIGYDRSDFIISGCAIFEAIRKLWPAAEITIADRGVREGIIMSLLTKQRECA